MPQCVYAIDRLRELDGGKVALAVDAAVQACVRDVLDRPGDESARKIVLTIEVRPRLDRTSAALDVAEFKHRIDVRLPAQQSSAYPMLVTRDGAALFQTLSPQDPRQPDFSALRDAGDAGGEDGEDADGDA